MTVSLFLLIVCGFSENSLLCVDCNWTFQEKLRLSLEQELVRVFGNLARTKLGKDLPYGVCSIIQAQMIPNHIKVWVYPFTVFFGAVYIEKSWPEPPSPESTGTSQFFLQFLITHRRPFTRETGLVDKLGWPPGVGMGVQTVSSESSVLAGPSCVTQSMHKLTSPVPLCRMRGATLYGQIPFLSI